MRPPPPLSRRALLHSLALSAVALRLPTANAAGRPIRLAQVAELTGVSATFGASIELGARLALYEANAAGGIAGHLVTLDTRDGSTPEACAEAATAILARRPPMAILGPASSTRSLAVAALTQPAGVPFMGTTSTSPRLTEVGDYTLRTCFIDPFQGTAMARWLLSQGLSRAAILLDPQNDYSTSLAERFKAAFTPGAVVATEPYREGDSDFQPRLKAVLTHSPDVLYLPGYYTEVGLIARFARELGFTGRFAGGDGWDSEHLYEIAQSAIEGGVYTNHWVADDPDPLSRAFVTRFQALHNRPVNALAALGYDAIGVVLAALRKVAEDRGVGSLVGANAAARTALRDAIAATTEYAGVTGPITMGPDRNPSKPAVLCEVTPDGPRFVARLPPG